MNAINGNLQAIKTLMKIYKESGNNKHLQGVKDIVRVLELNLKRGGVAYFENENGEVVDVYANTELLVKGDLVRNDGDEWDEEYRVENDLQNVDAYDPEVGTIDLEDCIIHGLLTPAKMEVISKETFESIFDVAFSYKSLFTRMTKANFKLRLLQKRIIVEE